MVLTSATPPFSLGWETHPRCYWRQATVEEVGTPTGGMRPAAGRWPAAGGLTARHSAAMWAGEEGMRKKKEKESGGGRGGRGDKDGGNEAAGGGGGGHQLELNGLAREAKDSMRKAVDYLESSLSGLRTRASPAMLDSVRVRISPSQEAVPLNKLALITQKDTGALRVALYDPSYIRQAEKAIIDTPDLELTPQIDGNQIHISVPKPTAELRQLLSRKVAEKGEAAKQSLRNARQKALAGLKRFCKDLSKDEVRVWEGVIQQLVDEHTKIVVHLVKAKDKELQQ